MGKSKIEQMSMHRSTGPPGTKGEPGEAGLKGDPGPIGESEQNGKLSKCIHASYNRTSRK